jgi:hypothetical protein
LTARDKIELNNLAVGLLHHKTTKTTTFSPLTLNNYYLWMCSRFDPPGEDGGPCPTKESQW